MLKTPGYDEAQSGFQQKEEITPGGHHLIIKQVTETMSKGDPKKGKEPKPMVVVLFDFAQNDTQAGMLMTEFKNDEKADKKWPHRGSSYIMVQDWQDPSKTNRNFKGFCTCFEQSNGCSINWVENANAWAAQFKNKKIGGVFGVVHDVYNGREFTKTELRWFTDDAKVANATIPEERMLTDKQKAQLNPNVTQNTESGAYTEMMNQASNTDDFVNVPEGVDEELPFR